MTGRRLMETGLGTFMWMMNKAVRKLSRYTLQENEWVLDVIIFLEIKRLHARPN